MTVNAPNVVFDRDAYAGALFWLVAALTFVAVLFVAEIGFGCANSIGCYNPLTNPISDLGSGGFAGNPPTYIVNGVATPWPTSPLWPVFNYGIVAFGALLVMGAFRLSSAFPSTRWATLSLGVLVLAGFGGAGVGIVPEDTILALHSIFALVAFVGAGLALLVMAASLADDRRWGRSWMVYTLASGLFSVAVTVVFILPTEGFGPAWAVAGAGFGYGGMERLLIAAPLLWLVLASVHILRRSHPSTDIGRSRDGTPPAS